MQKILIMAVCGVLLAAAGNAAVLLPCSTYAAANGGQGTDVNIIASAGGCTIAGGTITLTGFAYTGPQGNFFLDSSTQNGSVLSVGFNPSLLGTDIHFIFTVIGGIVGADLQDIAGPGTGISENQCTQTQSTTAAELSSPPTACLSAPALLWATSVSNPANPTSPGNGGEFMYAQGNQNVVYVWKDLNAVGTGGVNPDLSQFNETFAIPEPMSLLLLGSGLVGVGVLRFRRTKR